MVNPFTEVNWRPDRAGLRAFGRSLVIGFPIVAVVYLVGGRVLAGAWQPMVPTLLAGSGAGLGLIFVAVPIVARPFYVVWYALACTVGLVVSNTLMVVVYYGVVTPVGLGLRILGRRPLVVAPDRDASTYWDPVAPAGDRARYFRQF